MNNRRLILGIDTSNYKTSAALCDTEGILVNDIRRLLKVKQGERGLRQSHALFQHVENLPEIISMVFDIEGYSPDNLCAVIASSRPRNVEGSYMPCFNAGVSAGKNIAAALKIPFFETSHQEGHIEAIISGLTSCPNDFIALHLSGGTCELLKVSRTVSGYDAQIIGGSKDISYGQVLDRIGVAMGMAFPSGEEMDDIATNGSYSEKLLKPIKTDGAYVNLSGIETQAQRLIGSIDNEKLICEVFDKIADSLCKILDSAIKETGLTTAVFAGGVSSSKYISKKLKEYADQKGYNFQFGNQTYSSDNAVGVCLIGGRIYGNEAGESITTE